MCLTETVDTVLGFTIVSFILGIMGFGRIEEVGIYILLTRFSGLVYKIAIQALISLFRDQGAGDIVSPARCPARVRSPICFRYVF